MEKETLVPAHWIDSRRTAAILGLSVRGLDHLRVKGYTHPRRRGIRNYYDPQEIEALDEKGWPYRALPPQQARERELKLARERLRRYRNIRDPRPFPESWVPTRIAAGISGYSQNGLWYRVRRGYLTAVKWRGKLWFDPLTLQPDCATVINGGAER